MGRVTPRHLAWDGCVNVRDLGGLPLETGGLTPFTRVVRADNIRRLSAAGWEALRAYGVRHVVDLRFVRERSDELAAPEGIAVVTASLFGDRDPLAAEDFERVVRTARDEIDAIARFYTITLESRGPHVADALRAVADAPEGPLVVHCFVGKDRTGIVSALLLRLAGVPHDAVAEDYALSGPVVGPLVDDWIAAAEEEAERAFRRRVSAAPAEAMLRVLDTLERRWGGAEGYLRELGLTDDELARLRHRLAA